MSGSGTRDRSFNASSNESQQGSANSSNSFQDLFGQQGDFFNQLFSQAGQLSSDGSLSQVAGFDPFQVAGQNSAANFANGQANDSFTAANNALNQRLGGAGELVNSQVLQDAISAASRPVMENLNENLLTSNASEAVLNNGFGGSRQGIADGIAKRGANDKIGDISKELVLNAFNKGIDSQGRALNQAGNVANLGLFGSNILQGIGGDRQAQSQLQLDNPFNNLARLQGLLGNAIVLGQSQSEGASFGNSSGQSHGRNQGDGFSFNQVGG